MMKLSKKTGKTVATLGAIAGFVAASLQTRRLAEAAEDLDIAPEGTFTMSKSNLKKVATGVKDAIGEKRLSALAAGVAYYATLAFFPLLAAIVAIAALMITPEQLDSLIAVTEGYLPGDISSIVATQLQSLVERRVDNFLAAAIAIALALYGASGASKSLVAASNVVYGKKESRGWVIQQIIGVGWTVLGILFGFIVLSLMAVNQPFLQGVGIPEGVVSSVLLLRWVVVIIVTISGIAFFYRLGPNRRGVKLKWVAVGASLATIVWIVATTLFFAYLQNFANYTQSYSLFAGIIALMVWMNLSAMILLLGAEVNHQLEMVGRTKK